MPLRRADRLFDIIQHPAFRDAADDRRGHRRRARGHRRTVYRDIATLQARRVPIEGAAGIGYVLRRGFDLPPLMFTEDEVEAIAVGARGWSPHRRPEPAEAAESVLSKVDAVVPDRCATHALRRRSMSPRGGAPVPARRDLPETIRHAIREAQDAHRL